jgi:hypothetical protein
MDKYSPNWLLDKLNNSKTNVHKVMHIVDFKNNFITDQREILKFFAEQLRPTLEVDIGFDYIEDEDIEECIKNFNCRQHKDND